MSEHCAQYLAECQVTAGLIDPLQVEEMVDKLSNLEPRARIFFLGLGGSAANASHATNDFRKLCHREAYCGSDNVAELSAIANDEGFSLIYRKWLQGSNLGNQDALFILSVGGGRGNVSLPLIEAIKYAKSEGAKVFGIVGRDGGYTKREGHHVIVIPTVNDERVTPHAEAFQSVILHCLVSHPKLQKHQTKW